MTTTTLRVPFQFDTESQTESRAFSPSHIWTLFSLWYGRAHQRHQLSQLSSRQLKDIGVTRNQAIAEAAKPFWK
jgi:uncharacterized protein YjiS (DUF1127 family)